MLSLGQSWPHFVSPRRLGRQIKRNQNRSSSYHETASSVSPASLSHVLDGPLALLVARLEQFMPTSQSWKSRSTPWWSRSKPCSRCDCSWLDMAWYGMIWHDMTWYDEFVIVCACGEPPADAWATDPRSILSRAKHLRQSASTSNKDLQESWSRGSCDLCF
jgi:hypothetical protein